MPNKNIPIGIDNFAKLVNSEKGYLFVDKSLLIRDVLQDKSEVTLITRPRRWGKSLNLSMLQYFFASEVNGEVTAPLFESLKINNHPECMAYQGQYPVILISLKDVKQSSFEGTIRKIQDLMSILFERYCYLRESPHLSAAEKQLFEQYIQKQTNQETLENALWRLTIWLHRHHKKKVYLLIDEYDSPLNGAYSCGYLDEMTAFMKGMLGAALKSNNSLEKGIMTGVLRISKDSMLSGLNNLKVHTLINDAQFHSHFGFTEDEVNDLFIRSGEVINTEGVKAWYNGYQINHSVLFNPWSIMNCIERHGELGPYWLSTADPSLLKTALLGADAQTKLKFQRLLSGETITANVSEVVRFEEVATSAQALWSMLLNTGYLKVLSQIPDDDADYVCELAIPNEEIKRLYKGVFSKWLKAELGETQYQLFLKDLTNGNVLAFAKKLGNYLSCYGSYHDFPKAKESNYHTFMLGLLCSVTDSHYLFSNTEAGLGRLDILLVPKASRTQQHIVDLAIILEFKHAATEKDQEKRAEEALAQINTQHYIATLHRYEHIQRILKVGVSFYDKSLITMHSMVDKMGNPIEEQPSLVDVDAHAFTPSLARPKRDREETPHFTSLIDDDYLPGMDNALGHHDEATSNTFDSKRQRHLTSATKDQPYDTTSTSSVLSTYIDENAFLLMAKEASLAQANHQGEIGLRAIPHWTLHDVDDKGNCFYDAVVHQMQLTKHPFLEQVPKETQPRDSLRLLAQGPAFKDKEWADNVVINTLVGRLAIILLIVDTRRPERGFTAYYLGEDGDVITHTGDDQSLVLPFGRETLRLAYTGNHFLSVVQHPQLEQGVLRDAFDMRATAKSNIHATSSVSLAFFETQRETSSSSGLSMIDSQLKIFP